MKEKKNPSSQGGNAAFPPDPLRLVENSPLSYDGAKATLEFDLSKNRTLWLTACHANEWREIVETIEYRLANMEFTTGLEGHVKLIRVLLDELREACRERGVSTELMEEDRRDDRARSKS